MRPIVFVDVGVNGVDMNKVALASLVPQPRLVFDRIVAHGDDHVGRVEQLVGRLVMKQAHPAAETVKMLAWHDPGSLERAYDGEFRSGEQPPHGRRGTRLARQQSEQQQRPSGGVDQRRRRADQFGVGRADLWRVDGCEDVARRAARHDVLRSADERRARASRFGGAEGAGQHLRHGRRRIDFGAVLGDRPEQAHRVHALVDLLQAARRRHGPADGDDGITFRVGGRQPRHQV
ncbi:MAG TPA: hypothetical protein VG826_26630 [Pirellulales bacterium]|nr:hypothetical protein [Pirellulales bacterium]